MLLAWALSNLNGESVFVNLLDNAADLHNRYRFCVPQFLVDLGRSLTSTVYDVSQRFRVGDELFPPTPKKQVQILAQF